MNIAIIGSGVVGQATGMGFATHNQSVVFNDIDNKKLLSLSAKGYKTTRDLKKAVQDSELIFVCVPTPTVNKNIKYDFFKGDIMIYN